MTPEREGPGVCGRSLVSFQLCGGLRHLPAPSRPAAGAGGAGLLVGSTRLRHPGRCPGLRPLRYLLLRSPRGRRGCVPRSRPGPGRGRRRRIEDPHAQRQLGFHRTAPRAGLRGGKPAVGDDRCGSRAPGLVGELAADLPEPGIGDPAGQAPVAEHPGDVQVFHHDAVLGGRRWWSTCAGRPRGGSRPGGASGCARRWPSPTARRLLPGAAVGARRRESGREAGGAVSGRCPGAAGWARCGSRRCCRPSPRGSSRPGRCRPRSGACDADECRV